MFEASIKSGIYMILNLKTGKCYIGSARNIEKRKKEHFAMLCRNMHHSLKLQNSFNKHGEESFRFSVIEKVSYLDSLITVEQKYIDLYDSSGKLVYNTRPNAASNRGHKFSAEYCEKQRIAQTGKKQSPEVIEKRIAPLRGKPLSESHKKALGDSKRGRKRPDVSQWAPEKLSVLSRDQVIGMRHDHANGLTFRGLADKYKCNTSTAHSAVRGIGLFYSRIPA